jgi:Ca2+-binding RTX toxin-like protein
MGGTIIGQGGSGIIVAGGSTFSGGTGNDEITGIGGLGSTTNGSGILVSVGSLIQTESGNDRVDALIGGFAGGGTVDLGAGDDEALGFGEILLLGGTGRDELFFGGEGMWTIEEVEIDNVGPGFQISQSDVIMTVSGVEKIGSADSGDLVDLIAGEMTITGGVVSLA